MRKEIEIEKKLLIERIAENIKLLKRYEGTRVIGKNGGELKKWNEIRSELGKILKGSVFTTSDNKAIVKDSNNPYRLDVSYYLYIIDKKGKLCLHPALKNRIENLQEWILKEREQYDKVLNIFKQFQEEYQKLSADFLVRGENTVWLSDQLIKLSYHLSRKDNEYKLFE